MRTNIVENAKQNFNGRNMREARIAKIRPNISNWPKKKSQQNIQRAAGTVVLDYLGKTYDLVADYNFIFNDVHFNDYSNYGFGKQIGGKIGIIQDPFGTPVYIGATIPIPGVALNQLMLDPNGFLYATAMVDDKSGHYGASEMMYNSLFVWNTGKLIQTALDARQNNSDLSVPIDELPARYDKLNGIHTVAWIYGEGSYSARNVPKVYLHQVPALQSLAPSIYDSSKVENPEVPEPPSKDTSNDTWNTAMTLVGAQATQTYAFMAASLQSIFGEDNSAMLAKMNEAQSVMDTIGFDTQADGLGGLAAKGMELVSGATGGLLSVGMNVAGYAMRGFAETENLFHPGFVQDMPAPTDLLQLHDSGATLGEQINHVATAFIMPVIDGGLALIKGGADLMLGNWVSARNNLMDGLGALFMFKGGGELLGPKIIELKKQLQLKIKQAVFKAQEVMQGIITKSPLEFLRKGPDGREVIITEKTVPSSDPAKPPVKVTEVLTPEQVAKECSGELQINFDGSVEYKPNFCFAAGTLVHTKGGLKPIEQIKVGDWVLSKHESGAGEQAYKRVTRTFKFDDKPVEYLKYISTPLEKIEHVFVTPNHPFFVKEHGWIQAADVSYPFKLDSYDSTTLDAWECLTLWKTDTPEVAIALDRGADEGHIVDFRNGEASVGSERVSAAASTYDIFTRTVYNIEVEEFHTYYVGELGVWVHNTNCGGEGDVGRTQKPSVSPAEPVANSIANGKPIIYGRENGAVSPADLKAPGVILEYQYSKAVIDEAAAFEQSLPGAFQGKLGVKSDGSPRLETPQWSAVYENSNGYNTAKFDGRVPSLDLKEWTNTFMDGKLSLGPINHPVEAVRNGTRLSNIDDFRRRAESLNQVGGDLTIVIKNTRDGADNLASFNEAVDFISTVISKQDYWLKEGLHNRIAVNFEGRNTVIKFDANGIPYEALPEFTVTRVVNGKPTTVVVQGSLNKADYPQQPITGVAGDRYLAPNGQEVLTTACFDMDTQVATNKRGNGLTDICNIEVGDEVLSRNEVTGEQAYRRVLNKFVHHRKWLYKVKFSAAGSLDAVAATPEHPFWVVGKGWVPTCELQVGQELELCDDPNIINIGTPEADELMWGRRLNGQRWTAKVESIEPRKDLLLTVYNLEVEEFHTFFVGALGAWVHNTKDHFAGGATQAIVLEKLTPDTKPLVVFGREPSPTSALVGEYEAVDTLAQHRLDVVHLNGSGVNTLGKGTRRPDVLINGRTADVYTPKAIDWVNETVANKLWTILNEIVSKTTDQSSDIVLNLRETPEISVQAIHDYLSQNPVDGLSHLYVLKNGELTFREYRPSDANALVSNTPIYGYVDCKTGSYVRVYGPSKGYVGDPANNYGAYNLEVGAEGTFANGMLLTAEDIQQLLPAAKQYWLTAGASAAVLDATQITIADLPTGVAGQIQGNQITLSANGAGWGWFVDNTPTLPEEFTLQADATLQANVDTAASGKLDLLTVMIHELGHRLGLAHDSAGAMEATLQASQRQLPSAAEIALMQNIRAAISATTPSDTIYQTRVTQYAVAANDSIFLSRTSRNQKS